MSANSGAGGLLRPLMNTHEVADYLRVKERKIYDLIAQQRIPCTRVAGKWLFPKELIDLWLLNSAESIPEGAAVGTAPPAIITGSHDPLLDWAIRESGCSLAVLFNGSLDGLERFAQRQSVGCGLHVLDPHSGDYNRPLLERRLATEPVVALSWAQREQGLILGASAAAAGARELADLRGKRIAGRQKQAGSHLLWQYLLDQAGLSDEDFELLDPPLRNETEVALAVANDQADAGVGIATAARQLRLAFVPITRERYDLLLWRRCYFEPPLQQLLAFCRSKVFAETARQLGGYDVTEFGTVRFNGL